jgi:hypothetical protein
MITKGVASLKDFKLTTAKMVNGNTAHLDGVIGLHPVITRITMNYPCRPIMFADKQVRNNCNVKDFNVNPPSTVLAQVLGTFDCVDFYEAMPARHHFLSWPTLPPFDLLLPKGILYCWIEACGGSYKRKINFEINITVA